MNNFDIGTDLVPGDRKYQDDYLATLPIDDENVLLILADGMGGYAGGALASETVVKSFKKNFDTQNPNIKEALHKALIKANDDLHQTKLLKPEFAKMGTTFLALYVNINFVQWISVGDSPLYIISRDRVHNFGIKRINKNHSIAGLLELQLQHGEITQKEMDESPNKHMLTSAVSGDELTSIDLSKQQAIRNGDIFILASDGVETLSLEEIKNIALSSHDDASRVANILNSVIAKKSPNQDNASIISISFNQAIKHQEIPIEEDILKESVPKDKNKNMLIALIGILLIIISILIIVRITTNTPPPVADKNTTVIPIELQVKEKIQPTILVPQKTTPIIVEKEPTSKKEKIEVNTTKEEIKAIKKVKKENNVTDKKSDVNISKDI